MSAVTDLAQLLQLEVEDWYRCTGCDTIIDPQEYEIGPLYLCSNCGTMFTKDTSADSSSHRCPDCNKFGKKEADLGCPECNECDLFGIEVVECPWCEEHIPLDEFDAHITCNG